MADDEAISSDLEDAWYLRRLDGGLYTLQTVDYILAWIIMEDDGVRFSILFGLPRLSDTRNRFEAMPYKCLAGKARH
jgi:beta-catenin-like protein 1